MIRGDSGEAVAGSKHYDIVMVGAGLMGSAVAGVLAEKLPSKSILLLEAGYTSHAVLDGSLPPSNYDLIIPEAFGPLLPELVEDSKLHTTKYDLPGLYSQDMHCWSGDRDCSDSWGSKVPSYQCKVVGGCGVLNGALMQIPVESNFATWPAGWQWNDLKPYFDRVQEVPRYCYSILFTFFV